MNKKIILLLLAFSSYGFAMKRTAEDQNSSSNKKIDAKDQTIKQKIRNETKQLLNRIKELPNEIIEHEIKPYFNKSIFSSFQLFDNFINLSQIENIYLIKFSQDNKKLILANYEDTYLLDLNNLNDLKSTKYNFGCTDLFNIKSLAAKIIPLDIFNNFILNSTNKNFEYNDLNQYGSKSLYWCDSKRFALSAHTDSSKVTVWEMSNFKARKAAKLKYDDDCTLDMAIISPNGKLALTTCHEFQHAKLWDISDLKNIKQIGMLEARDDILKASFSIDSCFALISSWDETRLWNLKDPTNPECILDDQIHACKLKFNPSCNRVMRIGWDYDTTSDDLIAAIYDLANLKNKYSRGKIVICKEEKATEIKLSPDFNLAYTYSEELKQAKLWDLSDLDNIRSTVLNTDFDEKTKIKFSSDNKFMVSTTKKFIVVSATKTECKLWILQPNFAFEQIALLNKIDHLTKAGVNCNFLFDDPFYLDIFNQFNSQQQKNISEKFKLNIYDKNLKLKNLNQNLLMHNILEGNTANAVELVNSGIDLNSADIYGNTALIYAVHKNNLELIKLLASKSDIDIYHINKNNMSAIDLAEEQKPEAYKILAEALSNKYTNG